MCVVKKLHLKVGNKTPYNLKVKEKKPRKKAGKPVPGKNPESRVGGGGQRHDPARVSAWGLSVRAVGRPESQCSERLAQSAPLRAPDTVSLSPRPHSCDVEPPVHPHESPRSTLASPTNGPQVNLASDMSPRD